MWSLFLIGHIVLDINSINTRVLHPLPEVLGASCPIYIAHKMNNIESK